MNPRWILRTPRLVLTPVGGADLRDLVAIKADPQVFAVMLGGVRSPAQTQEELAQEVIAWGAEGFGIWAIREAAGGKFAGVVGLERRPDGRGVALRFALGPDEQGRGLAREAASAALHFGHEVAGLSRIVAVARASNFASCIILGSIGMRVCDNFVQDGWPMVMYESVRGTSVRIGPAADSACQPPCTSVMAGRASGESVED